MNLNLKSQDRRTMRNVISGSPRDSSGRKAFTPHEYSYGSTRQLRAGCMRPGYKQYKQKKQLLHQNYHHKNTVNDTKVRVSAQSFIIFNTSDCLTNMLIKSCV